MVICLHFSPTWFCLTSIGTQWILTESRSTVIFLYLLYFIVYSACVFTAVFWVIHLMCHLIQPTLEPLKSLHVAAQSPCLPPRCSTGSHMLTSLKFGNDLELVFGHLLEVYFSRTVYILSMLPLPSWSGLRGGGGGGVTRVTWLIIVRICT